MHTSGLLEDGAAVLLVVLAMLVAWWIPKLPRFENLDPTVGHGGRLASLDGLRGVLAMGVFLSHGLSYRQYYQTGTWTWPANHAFRFSGEASVAFFFAITGFLFWSQAIAGKVQTKRLYTRRFWRIYPLYLALVAVTLVVCAFGPGSWGGGKREFLDLLSGVLIPGRLVHSTIHGVDAGRLLTQTWSLLYEAAFYLLLPLFAPLARRATASYAMPVVMVVLSCVPALQRARPLDTGCLPFFAVGILTAQIVAQGLWTAKMRLSTTSIAVLLGLIVLCRIETTYSLVAIPLLLIAFIPVASGNDLFGALAWKPAKTLGDISYSLYMWHMAVMFVGLKFINWLYPIAGMSEVTFWLVLTFLVVLTVVLSLASYQIFERPFMSGKPERWKKEGRLAV